MVMSLSSFSLKLVIYILQLIVLFVKFTSFASKKKQININSPVQCVQQGKLSQKGVSPETFFYFYGMCNK